MKTNELRIGNLVFIENDLLPETKGKIHKVYGISEKHDSEFPKSTGIVSLNQISTIRNYSQFDEFIQPIPLTEEWLLKLGFRKQRTDTHLYMNGSLYIKINNNGFKFDYFTSIQYITYVHQLQNLYFILTGNELKIEI